MSVHVQTCYFLFFSYFSSVKRSGGSEALRTENDRVRLFIIQGDMIVWVVV